jgi:hypothetical protein
MVHSPEARSSWAPTIFGILHSFVISLNFGVSNKSFNEFFGISRNNLITTLQNQVPDEKWNQQMKICPT